MPDVRTGVFLRWITQPHLQTLQINSGVASRQRVSAGPNIVDSVQGAAQDSERGRLFVLEPAGAEKGTTSLYGGRDLLGWPDRPLSAAHETFLALT